MDELLSILHTLKPDVDFEMETDLVKKGVLDSLSLLTLVREIEETFDVSVPLLDVVPENFSSVQAMESMIERLQSE